MDRVIMKPEGSRKVAVLNGSRQLDKVIGGEWVTLKVEAEAGLPKGVYFLDEAQRPPVKREPVSYTGTVLQVDYEKVYQLHGRGIVVHDRAAFRDLENRGAALAVGQSVTVNYQNGRGAAVARGSPSRERGGGAEL